MGTFKIVKKTSEKKSQIYLKFKLSPSAKLWKRIREQRIRSRNKYEDHEKDSFH